MTKLLDHELLDRMYLIQDMFNDYIYEHPSDILSEEEKGKIMDTLADTYQLIGARIAEREENEGK